MTVDIFKVPDGAEIFAGHCLFNYF
jgi:hypothetical protein